mgnify:CR=1 FL=1
MLLYKHMTFDGVSCRFLLQESAKKRVSLQAFQPRPCIDKGFSAVGTGLAFNYLPKRSVAAAGNRNGWTQDLDARRKITIKKEDRHPIIIRTRRNRLPN